MRKVQEEDEAGRRKCPGAMPSRRHVLVRRKLRGLELRRAFRFGPAGRRAHATRTLFSGSVISLSLVMSPRPALWPVAFRLASGTRQAASWGGEPHRRLAPGQAGRGMCYRIRQLRSVCIRTCVRPNLFRSWPRSWPRGGLGGCGSLLLRVCVFVWRALRFAFLRPRWKFLSPRIAACIMHISREMRQ